PSRLSASPYTTLFRSEGLFTDRLHGLTTHPDGTLFIVDDAGHSVRHFTTAGKELGAIGPIGVASDTGYDGSNLATVARAAGPYRSEEHTSELQSPDHL